MPYKTIDGVKYDKKLLDMADELTQNVGDGRISGKDAHKLWDLASESGSGVSAVERLTLQYILANYTCTPPAKQFLEDMTGEVHSGVSYYKHVDGHKYVRALVDKAETLSKDGSLDKEDAVALWTLSMNGGRVTDTERKTVEYFLEHHNLTAGAKKFFEDRLAENPPSPKKGVKRARGSAGKTRKKKGDGDDAEWADDGEESEEGDDDDGKPKRKRAARKKTKGKKKKGAEEDMADEEEEKEGEEEEEAEEEEAEEAEAPEAEEAEAEPKAEAEAEAEVKEISSSSVEGEYRKVQVKVKCTLVELAEAERVPYVHGCGYYQLGATRKKKELVQGYKKLVAIHTNGEVVSGEGSDVRTRLGLGLGDLTLSADDIPEGWVLYIQSTSPQRQILPGTLALLYVGERAGKATKHRHTGEQKAAAAGGRAHFSGALMGDNFQSGTFSECFVEDQYSEYVGVGGYFDNSKAFPKAIAASFDSIAVDAGTKVTIYSKPGFQGDVLYSRTGPAVVINNKWEKILVEQMKHALGVWKEPLNSIFPPSCRELSATDMHAWNTGSLIISEGEAIPEETRKLNAEYAAVPPEREEGDEEEAEE